MLENETLWELVARVHRRLAGEAIEHAIVGGVAVCLHGYQRNTVDLDLLVEPKDATAFRSALAADGLAWYPAEKEFRSAAGVPIQCVLAGEAEGPGQPTFVAKAATLLKNNICLSIVDVVSTFDFNLYAELMSFLNGVDPALGNEPSPMYATTLRMRYEDGRRLMDNWYHQLAVGETLPTLPIWLTESRAISLNLESSYQETCRALRIR